MTSTFNAFLLAAFLTLLTGCAENELVPVAGTALLDGKPLARANITLLPETNGKRPAVALTNELGEFKVATGNHAGAAIGNYKVVVSKDEVITNGAVSQPPPVAPEATTESTSIMRFPDSPWVFPVRRYTPEIYGDGERTPLRCTIERSGAVDLLFRLDSSVR